MIAYHVVIARFRNGSLVGPWEIHFGDFDKDCVNDELDDLIQRHDVKEAKIVTADTPNMFDIDRAIALATQTQH